MAKRLYIDELIRLTLVQKGKATAKHPLLREGVVEVVKALDDEAVKATPAAHRYSPQPLPPALPNFGALLQDEFGRALRGALHGDGTPSQPTPAADSFEAVLNQALHSPGSPLPAPWGAPTVTHKATTTPTPFLSRYFSGQRG